MSDRNNNTGDGGAMANRRDGDGDAGSEPRNDLVLAGRR